MERRGEKMRRGGAQPLASSGWVLRGSGTQGTAGN